MSTESVQLAKKIAQAERPFAQKAFNLRLQTLYPAMSALQRDALATGLCNQVYRTTAVSDETFIRLMTENGLAATDYPAFKAMVGDMIAAFVGLGADILELGPDSVRWSNDR